MGVTAEARENAQGAAAARGMKERRASRFVVIPESYPRIEEISEISGNMQEGQAVIAEEIGGEGWVSLVEFGIDAK